MTVPPGVARRDLTPRINQEARMAWLAQHGRTPTRALPAPECTSRDPWPDQVAVPPGVVRLDRVARACGWITRLTYSRGPKLTRAAVTIVDSVMLRGSIEGRFAHVMYMRGDDGKWLYRGSLVSGGMTGIFPRCNVTELREFLEKKGCVPPAFFEAITLRVESAALAARERAAGKPSQRKARVMS